MRRFKTFISVCILFSIMAFFTGCDKKTDQSEEQLLIEDTTEIIPQPSHEENKTDIIEAPQEKKVEIATPEIPQPKSEISDPVSTDEEVFIFKNADNDTLELLIDQKEVSFKPDDKTMLLINFFEIDDPASAVQFPYLMKLQNKYSEKIAILGIPINAGHDDTSLHQFVQKYQLDFFICDTNKSDSLVTLFRDTLKLNKMIAPVTLLYGDGKLYTSYEGAVPIEMITHDILSFKKE